MEIKKIECPSCGAPVEWNSSSCGFCKTELRFFEDEGAALPINLTAEDVESNIIHLEKEFWDSTIKAIDAPYSLFKDYKHYSLQDFKTIFKDTIKPLKLFFESYFIFPSENLVIANTLNDIGGSFILTNLRLIILNDTVLLSIPLENFISWAIEKSPSGSNVIGRDGLARTGQPVLRYLNGTTIQEIRFDPADDWVKEVITQSVIICKDWQDIKPIQKNLLTFNRYKINKTYKIEIKPLELIQFSQAQQQSTQQKKGCFVATATMGDYNHPIVIQLRDFRDNFLDNKALGKSFIKWYYKNGPSLANIIEKNYILKKLCYWLIIKPLVLISKVIKHF